MRLSAGKRLGANSIARPPVLRERRKVGNWPQEFPTLGAVSQSTEMNWKGAPEMGKFGVIWSALAASVVTLGFPVNSFAEPEQNIAIATLLKGGWQIAPATPALDDRSAFILFRHLG